VPEEISENILIKFDDKFRNYSNISAPPWKSKLFYLKM
jgi:hypothetical protein